MLSATNTVNKTPLYDIHNKIGGKIVDFHGWLLPVQYSGIIDEHNAVRGNAGFFDLSHMGEIEVYGKQAREFLDYVLCGSLCRLSYDGKIMYSAMLNNNGGIIDDLLVYRRSENSFLLVVNASNKDKDYAWLLCQSKQFNVQVIDKSMDTGLVAIQGQKSADILKNVVNLDLAGFYYYHFIESKIAGVDVVISRTGYTGEDGFEVYAPWGKLPDVWEALFKSGQKYGARPIGLGARDTLRLEMRYPLHGNDIDENTTPLEAGLSWITDFNKQDFIGKGALELQKSGGVSKSIIGFVMAEKGIPRSGYSITDGDNVVGKVTSGTLSPTLSEGIGIAYVDPRILNCNAGLFVSIHGKLKKISLHKGPFVKPNLYVAKKS